MGAVSSYRGEFGHSLVFARDAFDELRRLHGDKAVWKLPDAYPERFLQVAIDSEMSLDVDTSEDYQCVLTNWGY